MIKFKVLTYKNKFVDCYYLATNLYIIKKWAKESPDLFSINTNMNDIIKLYTQSLKYPWLSRNKDIVLKNLKECELKEINLTYDTQTIC